MTTAPPDQPAPLSRDETERVRTRVRKLVEITSRVGAYRAGLSLAEYWLPICGPRLCGQMRGLAPGAKPSDPPPVAPGFLGGFSFFGVVPLSLGLGSGVFARRLSNPLHSPPPNQPIRTRAGVDYRGS